MKEATDGNFKELTEKGMTIIAFSAPWCPPCRMLTPVLEELANEYNEITIAKMNVDENSETPAKFGIKSIPTVLFFYNGELTDKFVGFKPKDEIKNQINEINGKQPAQV